MKKQLLVKIFFFLYKVINLKLYFKLQKFTLSENSYTFHLMNRHLDLMLQHYEVLVHIPQLNYIFYLETVIKNQGTSMVWRHLPNIIQSRVFNFLFSQLEYLYLSEQPYLSKAHVPVCCSFKLQQSALKNLVIYVWTSSR